MTEESGKDPAFLPQKECTEFWCMGLCYMEVITYRLGSQYSEILRSAGRSQGGSIIIGSTATESTVGFSPPPGHLCKVPGYV